MHFSALPASLLLLNTSTAQSPGAPSTQHHSSRFLLFFRGGGSSSSFSTLPKSPDYLEKPELAAPSVTSPASHPTTGCPCGHSRARLLRRTNLPASVLSTPPTRLRQNPLAESFTSHLQTTEWPLDAERWCGSISERSQTRPAKIPTPDSPPGSTARPSSAHLALSHPTSAWLHGQGFPHLSVGLPVIPGSPSSIRLGVFWQL